MVTERLPFIRAPVNSRGTIAVRIEESANERQAAMGGLILSCARLNHRHHRTSAAALRLDELYYRRPWADAHGYLLPSLCDSRTTASRLMNTRDVTNVSRPPIPNRHFFTATLLRSMRRP